MKDVFEDYCWNPTSKPAPTRQVLQLESKRKADCGPIKILYPCNISRFTVKIK
jgi:hypothetical protein